MRILKYDPMDIPGGSVVKNPPANAGNTFLFDSPSEKIPHAAEQLSLNTRTTEPVL